MRTMDHKDGDPDETPEEYDRDNYSDQENSNNDESDKYLPGPDVRGSILGSRADPHDRRRGAPRVLSQSNARRLT